MPLQLQSQSQSQATTKLKSKSQSPSPASIHTIPIELVQEILIHAVVPIVHNHDDPTSIIPTFPFGHHPHTTRSALLQLNSTFANLVRNTPRLWSTLFLDGSIPASRLLCALQTCLQYSKSAFLSVYLHLERLFPLLNPWKETGSGSNDGHDDFTPTYRYTPTIRGHPGMLSGVFMMLGGEMGRVQSLVMDLRHPRSGCFPPVAGLFGRGDMPYLKELVLLGFTANASAELGRKIHAPRLRVFEVGYGAVGALLEPLARRRGGEEGHDETEAVLSLTRETIQAVKESRVTFEHGLTRAQWEGLATFRGLEKLTLVNLGQSLFEFETKEVVGDRPVILPALKILAIHSNVCPDADDVNGPCKTSDFRNLLGRTTLLPSLLVTHLHTL